MTDRLTINQINSDQLDQLYERLADYENRITWHTTCASCARVLDSSIRETNRAERAEATVARIRAALASFDDRGVLRIGHTNLDIPTAGEVLTAIRNALDPQDTP